MARQRFSNHRVLRDSRRGIHPPIWRRLFHATAGSVIPVAAIFAPKVPLLAAVGALCAVLLLVDVVRFRWPVVNQAFMRWLAPLLKAEEDSRITGATYMTIASLLALLLFHKPVAVAALLFLSLGDPAAALIGRRAGPRFRLLGKSPAGTLAFVVVALGVAVALIQLGEVQPHWGLAVGAAVAGLVELMPLPVDDNLSVPLSAGALMQLLGVA
ncbi:MAG: hypothetical protein FJ316_00720 [SAR202 cluster bacterium]|nr:hypothetical protein [SAR202 cluster bacterium]